MCYEHMKKAGECPICDADEAVNSIDWLDSEMSDQDKIRERAIRIARNGEGAIVAEICWLLNKTNEQELRIKRLTEMLEEM